MATELNFTLHPAQQEIFKSSKRFKVVGAGRRFGKSYLARVKLIVEALKSTNEYGYDLAFQNLCLRLPDQECRSVQCVVCSHRHKLG